MKHLVSFIKATKKLKSHLEKKVPEQDRVHYIETINRLLEERQESLNDFADLSSLEEHTKKDLIQLENDIQELMAKHKHHIQQDLKNLQLKKRKNNQYSDPYGNVSADGMFLDKKK